MSEKLLGDVSDSMLRATCAADLIAEAARFARRMEFQHFAYVGIFCGPGLRTNNYVLHGYPPSWVSRYLSNNYFERDPLIRHATTTSAPTIWDTQFFVSAGARDFGEEANAAGIASGLTIPVHGQLSGVFSMARDKADDRTGQDLAALIGSAQMFASLLHHAVMTIEAPRMIPAMQTALTCRERECLRWTADGKTAWEIGQILGITERTVVYHVNNIVQKLGATNKIQAIVRAVAFKLI